MPRRNESSLPELGAWQVEALRISIFRLQGESDPDPNVWRSVAGDDPETQVSKPKTGERFEAGAFGEGKLILQVQPIRIDWIYAIQQDVKQEDSPETSLPPLLDLFCTAMIDWLKVRSAAERLAFGAVLRLPITNREEGYRQISEFLPFEVDPQTSSDFSYQINRPRDSTSIPGLKINRLSKWSVGLTLRQFIHVEAGRGSTVEALPSDQHCRLELDINSSPDFPGSLTSELMLKLLDELVDLGREIVQHGDRP